MASPHNRLPMGGIDGVVVDASSGASVVGASVFVKAGSAPAPDIAALTGERGDFTLDLPPGDWVIGVLLPSGAVAEFNVQLAPGVRSTTTLRVPVHSI